MPHVDEMTGPNGLKMFSATRIFSPWANEQFQEAGISEKKLSVASAKGTLVHDWCLDGYALSFPKKPLPDIYKGYGESFKKWFDKHVVEVVWVEQLLKDEVLGVYGTPDLLAWLDFGKGRVLGLSDIKTPVQYSQLWQVQLSTYLHLCRKNGWNPDYVGSLQLDINGDWPKPHKHVYAERDMAIVLSALQVRRYLG